MKKVKIKPKFYQKLKSGYLWGFSQDIKSFDPNITDGEIVDIYLDNQFVAKGYFNSKSKIMLRVLSFEDIEINYNFFKKKLTEIYNQKKLFFKNNNFRLVYSEGDFLPGLIIDLFEDFESKKLIAVCMFLTKGIENLKDIIIKVLLNELNVNVIIERGDSNLRKLEGLELKRGFINSKINLPFKIEIDDIIFLIDPLNGQKTGFYYDQTLNRRFLNYISKDKIVLDCFSYTGAFGMYALKNNAKFVEFIDESEFASNIVLQQAKLNNFQNKFIFHKDNVFSKLRELVSLNKEFDIVIIDPPSFTKTKEKIDNAIKAYKDVNLQGLKLVKNGGFLLTSSCSQKIKENDFYQIFLHLFEKMGIKGKLVYKGQQSFDHPINFAMEETKYLKFFVFQIFK
ncbi:MAG: class I SAM-dependent rRNA methyltransferase [bacterium]|jgi:23S rRNA (cytosine1962-C5)-methyltransferase